MSGLLQLDAVDLDFGPIPALRAIDLRIASAERVALVGANGSGKSTLLRVLHGLLKPTRGSLQRDGLARQAMVFQRPYMLRTSALNNVALGLWIRGQTWAAARAGALRALAGVDLGEVALRHARSLSSGQQQRLALDLLVLDEPTSSLDPHAKREVEALMATLARSGVTLVFASHNLGQVKRLATRVVYLERGRVLADLPVHDFFNGPRLRDTSLEADLFVKGELT
jgi:tungstate transport system ATP-binding protein